MLQYLKTGRENAIPRSELAKMAGVSDRMMRQSIEDLRNAGYPICNLQDGKGYFLADDPQDLKAQMAINKSRAMSILVQQKHLKRKLKDIDKEES
ncbi:MAG: HTH domain-containing protein [Ruminococcaceae bacterium]|nr:HTH domain-containing protein [Oscillospiraceae bacterium]